MAEFKLDAAKGKLIVRGELVGTDDIELRRRCDDLIRGGSKKLTVDMCGVEVITSMCVGIIAALWLDAITMERDLVVIPSAEVRRVFTLAGFDRVFKLKDSV